MPKLCCPGLAMKICKRATWLVQYVPNNDIQQQQTCGSTATYIAKALSS